MRGLRLLLPLALAHAGQSSLHGALGQTEPLQDPAGVLHYVSPKPGQVELPALQDTLC